MNNTLKILTILGHTAAGKTKLAALLAHVLDGEVISADSRQVYRGMDIGTGKDYEDYNVGGRSVAYHLVDITDAGTAYNVYEFQKDFKQVAEEIDSRGKLPVLCGGTGMYIESVLRDYRLTYVPVNTELRERLDRMELHELEQVLKEYKNLHNQTDTDTKKRAIRAIEIAEYMDMNPDENMKSMEIRSLNIGIRFEREERRRRITSRLEERLNNGMIEEAETLLQHGVTYAQMEYYGLEYKYLSYYLANKISYDEMFSKLNTAIHRFAKRQMTYFRGMERKGVKIHWIEGTLPLKEIVEEVRKKWEGFITN